MSAQVTWSLVMCGVPAAAVGSKGYCRALLALLPSLLEVDMASRWYHLVIDAKDPAALARFWAAVLGYQLLYEGPGELVIGTGAHDYPGICFVPVPEDKAGKNRLHIDLDPDDRDAEVERILALGARHADVGQGDVSWVVLADPEGNEFCVLRPHRSLVD